MPYCVQCGSANPAGYRFCAECGAAAAAPGAAGGAPPAVSEPQRILGLLGAGILFVGVFTPIVSVPIMGNQNYFQNGRGEAIVLVLMALIAVACTITRRYRLLFFPGIVAAGVLLFTFVQFQRRLADMRESVQTELAGNPFAGIAELAVQAMQLQWGWAVLLVGTVLIVVAAALPAPPRAAPAPS